MHFYDSVDKWFEKFADKLIWVFIAFYVILLSAISFYKFYSFGYLDWDLASDLTILWNTIHGNFLYYPFLEQNIFGAHLYLIILPILPVYALFQHPLTLLFLQSFFFGLAAYPLYLFAKTQVSKATALFVAVLYLLYPSIGFINLFEAHFEIYEIFFLFFALYFFEKENFRNFMVFIVLALACKENVSFVVFMFGFYSVLRKRSIKWIATPIILGMAWFLLAVKWIIPYFAKDAKLYQEGFMFSIYYKHLGNTMFEMLKTLVTHPVSVARFVLMPQKIVYLFQLFAPVGLLSFFSPGPLIMTIPIFIQNLLSLQPTHAMIQYQYAGLLIPFIFASVVLAFKRFLAKGNIRRKRFLMSIFLLTTIITAGIYFKAPQLFFFSYLKAFLVDDEAKAKIYMIEMIPAKAPVIATFKFLPHLANRHELYSLHLVSTGYRMYTKTKYIPSDNLEYALIDFNDPLTLGSFFPQEAPSNIRTFLATGKWKILAGAGENILFKKGMSSGFSLNEVIGDPKIENKVDIDMGRQMNFLGYNISEKKLGKIRVLHLTTYWKRLDDINGILSLFVLGLNSQGLEAFGTLHPLGYRVYPPAEWPKDKATEENVFVLIPSGVPIGEYELRMGLVNLQDMVVLPASDKKKTDALGRVILKNISLER